VTGLGVITPVGNDVDSAWEALTAGKGGIARISRFDPEQLATQFAGEVKGFEPAEIFGRKEARRMDRVTQFSMEASRQALEDSGLLNDSTSRERVGVIIGTAVGGMDTILDQVAVFQTRGPARVNPFYIPMMLLDTPGTRVSLEYGLHGPNLAIVSACATGTHAIGEAFEMIVRGDADAVLAGGSESPLQGPTIAGFNAMTALSTRNDAPERASRPFDAERDGFVPAEGAAILILEELEHAQARDANILAEMVGYGNNADGYHVAAPLESGEFAQKVMLAAIQRAGLSRDDVDHINAHGTSTPLNDVTETRAIKAAFGERAYQIPITATKSMTGHLMGGAGAIEAFVCVKTIHSGVIPPTINYENPDPECDLDYVPNQARPADVDVVLSNSFGFGGHNACIVFRRYVAQAQ
jgi:3-oxoacyl-[acyl-carrier-protein] synthase II